MPTPPRPVIGVFDSGFGGLTVLRALLALLPSASFVYLGDTARLPYGSKSAATVARYATSSAEFLVDQGADLLVIACNTATALALPAIQAAVAPLPVFGVIDPGATAAQLANANPPPSSAELATAARSTHGDPPAVTPEPGTPSTQPASSVTTTPPLDSGPSPGQPPHVLVLATDATVQSHAYLHALHRLGLAASEKSCPLLVPLVEEGWIDHPVTREVTRIYLTEALAAAPATTTLLLGCTHYPLLRPVFEQTLAALGRPLRIIDSAEATAHAVAAHLQLLPRRSEPNASSACTFFATDSVEKFARLGSAFLGRPLPSVQLVDLGG